MSEPPPTAGTSVALRSGWGYLAGAVGALGGAVVGTAAGTLIGPAGFGFALGHVHPDEPSHDGVAGAIEGVGVAIGTAVFAAAFAALMIIFCVWLGAVLGCGLAIRVCGLGMARFTALTFGAVAPLVFLAFAFVVGRFTEVRGEAAYVFHPAWIATAACLGRWLTVRRS